MVSQPISRKPLRVRAVSLIAEGATVEIAAACEVEVWNLIRGVRVEIVDGKAYVQQL